MTQLRELVPAARRRFDHVTVGAQDALRAEPAVRAHFVRTAVACGAARVRLADTVGTATPVLVQQLPTRMPEVPGHCLEFHGHNDLGMATANAVMAAVGGFGAVSVTVNGLGERAGNAALEEVVTALKVATPLASRVRLAHLNRISRFVARAVDRPLARNKPIVGADVFRHTSGIHCAALLKNPLSYQPFLPRTVGAPDTVLVVGEQSGSTLVRHKLRAQGRKISRRQARSLLPLVRRAARCRGGVISDVELEKLYLQNCNK